MGKSWKKQVEARLEISRESAFPFPIEISMVVAHSDLYESPWFFFQTATASHARVFVNDAVSVPSKYQLRSLKVLVAVP